MNAYVIRPTGARFVAQANAAAKLPALTWDGVGLYWTTTDAAAVAVMRRLGANVTETTR
jgi:hypothetical protein